MAVMCLGEKIETIILAGCSGTFGELVAIAPDGSRTAHCEGVTITVSGLDTSAITIVHRESGAAEVISDENDLIEAINRLVANLFG